MSTRISYHWRRYLGEVLLKEKISRPTGRRIILHMGKLKDDEKMEKWAEMAAKVILETKTEEEILEKLGLTKTEE